MAKLLYCFFLAFIGLTSCAATYSHTTFYQVVSISKVSPKQKPYVLKAIQGWNKLLDYNYFVVRNEKPTLFIYTDFIDGENTAGTHHRLEMCQVITIHTELDSSLVTLVAYHELGHAIGLDHSIQRPSIMYPSLVGMGTFQPSQDDVTNAWNEINRRAYFQQVPLTF